MALTWKDSASKKVSGKRTVKITNVSIENGELHDEEGSIGARLEEILPMNCNVFDIKLAFDLPDEIDLADMDDEDDPVFG